MDSSTAERRSLLASTHLNQLGNANRNPTQGAPRRRRRPYDGGGKSCQTGKFYRENLLGRNVQEHQHQRRLHTIALTAAAMSTKRLCG